MRLNAAGHSSEHLVWVFPYLRNKGMPASNGGYPNAYGTRAVCLLPGGAEAVLSACIYCKSFEEASGV